MQKLLLAAALTVVLALSLTGTATAQTQQYGVEVCVNASNADDAKRLFPNATLHILRDFPDPLMNGWRHVSGAVKLPGGRIMTDAEEIQLRERESNPTRSDS